MPNRLASESSPYLKQHAENPVDWYPWSEEALTRARTEDKPILLSVGYSACHWCHVMEHESFENPDIARLMNENFINIKVDREERPDLDQVYQNVSQLMTRSGGWPLTVFLTPDLRPFFGGTYFPPEDRYGRPGFPRVLMALSKAYREDRNSVTDNAARLTEAIGHIENARVDEHERPDAQSLRKIVDSIASSVDWRFGGLGGAPKFPQTMNLTLLWRYGIAKDFGMAQDAATLSLTRMAEGGICDHIGGGFHRYSVDEKWSVPHFEKMLYDNALLLKLYSEVLVTAKPDMLSAETRELFLRVIRETTQYVLREMRSPEGGFYSTQDADSEGEEGKFFVWNPKEISSLLTEEEARVALMRFGITEEGNFEETGNTVAHLAASVSDIASRLSLTEAKVRELIDSARNKLFTAREKRIRPGRDEKVLASWNGLMISGMSWAARALALNEEPTLAGQAREAAQGALTFVLTKMSEGSRLKSVWKDGAARFNGYLDDYAFMAMGALDLARVTEGEQVAATATNQARQWIDSIRAHFTDSNNGGFFFTSDDHEKLIQRPKTLYDQAIPSGNAVTAECMLVLGEMLEGTPYADEADELLYKFYPTVLKSPHGLGELACAAMLYLAGPVTVSGPGAQEACMHPHVFRKPAAAAQGVSLVVCHRRTCEEPVTDVAVACSRAVGKANSL